MTREEAIEILWRYDVNFEPHPPEKVMHAIDMAIEALQANAVQDGRNNIKRYPNCQMRTSLGNCDAIGGFCTSINAPICDAFHKLVEAVQGEWILVKGSNGKDYHKCSKCLHTQEITGVKNYCAVCGARMKGGVE